MVRVHSSTETGEILGNLFEGYGHQLQRAMEMIAKEGKGALVYMRHSEMPDAILGWLEDCKRQLEKGEEPELSISRGEMSQRDYGVGAQIIRELGISKIRLLTNHPRRRIGLIGYGLEIVENIELK
jgi:3,4-dihydroxy 2-butanone 4-phosphate synthase/GTP cyclohydrolase II